MIQDKLYPTLTSQEEETETDMPEEGGMEQGGEEMNPEAPETPEAPAEGTEGGEEENQGM